MTKKLLLQLLFGCFSVFLSQVLYAQEIKGTVTSTDKNELLPGVNVVIKGTNNGTVTNANGTFVIKVSNPKATLVLSSIGFVKQEMPLNGQSQVSIQLQPDEQTLSEVVVVGYGEVKRNNLTGAQRVFHQKKSKNDQFLVWKVPWRGNCQGLMYAQIRVNLGVIFKFVFVELAQSIHQTTHFM